MRRVVVIPARLASSRVPNKALAELAGLPLLEHVRLRCLEADVGEVVIATDSDAIATRMKALGAQVLHTGPAENGTRRVALAMERLDAEVALNVQGDQPLVCPGHIRTLAELMDHSSLGTLAAQWRSGDDPRDRAKVKIAVRDGLATAFSRDPIPEEVPRLHLGLYGYSRAMLRRVTALPIGVGARAESLEQLTWLEAGLPICVRCVGPAAPSVDTKKQLEDVRALLQSNTSSGA